AVAQANHIRWNVHSIKRPGKAAAEIGNAIHSMARAVDEQRYADGSSLLRLASVRTWASARLIESTASGRSANLPRTSRLAIRCRGARTAKMVALARFPSSQRYRLYVEYSRDTSARRGWS